MSQHKAQNSLQSNCVCHNNTTFVPFISYTNETIFKNYEGIIIGKCTNCGLLKTLSSSTIPTQSHIETYTTNEKEYRTLFQPLLAIIKKYRPRVSVLDVGCANGILLQMLEENKYEVHGIEPNANAFKQAQHTLGSKVFYGTISSFSKVNKSQFDIIIYNHVLEHVPNINEEVKHIKKLLKPHGILIIGVPNTNNVIFSIRKKFWESLLPLEHVWHFSDTYLRKLFFVYNFQVIDTYYFNHLRSDYPLVKRIYFTILCGLNRILHTGEAVLLVMRNS